MPRRKLRSEERQSRGQRFEMMIEENAAGVDNRRGKRRRADEEEASTLTPTPTAVNLSRTILAKTLEYMAAKSIENKRQKLAEMGMRNIRDKLVARRRNEDGILQQPDRLSRAKKRPDQALLDRHTAIENEIASLEKKPGRVAMSGISSPQRHDQSKKLGAHSFFIRRHKYHQKC
jgi:hypothetical protein